MNFKYLPPNKALKVAITPSGNKNNLLKKSLFIQTSSNLAGKKISVNKTRQTNDQVSKSSKEPHKTSKERSTGNTTNTGVNLKNNNIIQDGLIYIKDRESQTTKNGSHHLNQKYTVDSKKFIIDNNVIRTNATSSNKQKTSKVKDHSNIMKLFKK